MEVRAQRPQLVSLRVTSFHGDNTALASPPQSLGSRPSRTNGYWPW